MECTLRKLAALEPEEILPRLIEGDPFGIQPRCMHELRSRALIIDPDQLVERTCVEVAFLLPRTASPDSDDAFLDECVGRGIRWILRREAEAERSTDAPDPSVHEFLFRAFGVAPQSARHAAADFHRLPERTRKVFFALCVEGWSVSRCLEDFGIPLEHLSECIWEACRALGHVTEEELEAFREKEVR